MTLTVGDPPRTLQLDADTASTAHAYLRGRRHGPLLLGERRPRHADRLTRFGIDYVVKQAAQAAGLAGTVSRNTLRRRYVVAAHARGVDLDDFVAAPDTPTNGRPAAISHRRLRARTLIEPMTSTPARTPSRSVLDDIDLRASSANVTTLLAVTDLTIALVLTITVMERRVTVALDPIP